MTASPPFDHLIFDCDGVIVDSEIVATRISLRMLKPYGYDADELTHATRYAGYQEHEILQRLRTEEGLDLPPDFGPKLVQEVHNRMFDELHPIAGMPELIRSLDRPLAVASNSGVAHVRRSLALAGVTEIVADRVFSAEHVAQPKPHPDLYLHALGSLKIAAERTVVVEDSIAGVTSAKAAGLYVIGFLGASHISDTHGKQLQDVGVDALAQNAGELDRLLGQLLSA